MKQNGGVVMVNFYSGFIVPESGKKMRAMLEELRTKYPDRAERAKAMEAWYMSEGAKLARGTYRDVADHIDHIVKVAGIDHVGIGSDFDGITMWPVGLDDVSSYPRLTDELFAAGTARPTSTRFLGAMSTCVSPGGRGCQAAPCDPAAGGRRDQAGSGG